MGRSEVARLRTRLDATFKRIPPATVGSEVQSDYAKYLCVLVSGFLENAVVALSLDFIQKRSGPEITSYLERHLHHWTNPNTDRISKLLGSFSSIWRADLDAYLIDERKATINSLVALRHKIAHGESVSTSLSQVKDYYRIVLEVVDHLADMIHPPRGGR